MYMTVTLQSEHYQDKAWLFLEDHCIPGFDNGWDGYKISTSATSAHVYLIGEEKAYQVSSTNEFDNVYLGIQAGEKDSEYRLALHTKNLISVYKSLDLLDLKTGKSVDLLTNDSISFHFTAVPGENMTKRFKITSNRNTMVLEEVDVTQIRVYAYNKVIYIDNHSDNSGLLTVYDLMGKKQLEQSFAANRQTSVPTSLIPGIYIIKLMYGDKVKTQKIRL